MLQETHELRLLDLPDECIELILSHCHPIRQYAQSLSRVCKKWSSFCSSDVVWLPEFKRLHLSQSSIASRSIRDVVKEEILRQRRMNQAQLLTEMDGLLHA